MFVVVDTVIGAWKNAVTIVCSTARKRGGAGGGAVDIDSTVVAQ